MTHSESNATYPGNGQPLVIATENLTKAYGRVNALTDLALEVPRGSICGFLGPNGAGKTSTLKLLLGLNRPTRGSGRILGLDIVRESAEIRRRVGYLAQEPRFYDHLTARQTLRFAARFFYQGTRAGIEQRLSQTLELVGLADKADRPVRGFSGGERQRLGIAQAQINLPELLILDEPAAALDPLGRRDVLALIQRLRDGGATVFYSTHLLDDVQRVSDMAVIIDHGRLVAQAPIGALVASAETHYALTVAGATAPSLQRLRELPWVKSVRVGPANGGATQWQVSVTDDAMARAHLLRAVLADAGVTVISFGPTLQSLEKTFIDLVQGRV